MLDLLLRESLWFFSATGVSVLSAIGLVVIGRRQHAPIGVAVTAALNLLFGLWIGIMGAGHLFAVTTKALLGILRPDINLWFAIPFGLAMAVPGWWLVGQVRALLRQNERSNSQAMWLNAWLALVLIVPAGPPAALPAVNAILLLVRRRGRRAWVRSAA
jgi:hypothetical protein